MTFSHLTLQSHLLAIYLSKEHFHRPAHQMGLLLARKYDNPIRTLTFRCFLICSSSSLLRSSLSELKELLSQNGYPTGIVNYIINDVLNRQQNRQREPITTVPKNEILLILPFLGLQSSIIAKHLKACINIFYGCIDLRVILQSNRRIKSFFPSKTGSTVHKCHK